LKKSRWQTPCRSKPFDGPLGTSDCGPRFDPTKTTNKPHVPAIEAHRDDPDPLLQALQKNTAAERND
jgi:hypothetical protein